MTKPNSSSDLFRAAADIESRTPITVGTSSVGPEGRLEDRGISGWHVFARLIELRRRQMRLSVEALASQANIDLEDIVRIERGDGTVQEPRTVHQIAQVLRLPEHRLNELAGLVEASDRKFHAAGVRFAARSESIQELRPEELEALEEYVKVLAEP